MKIQKDPKLWEPPENGYRIETGDETWDVMTMIDVNQNMSALCLEEKEAIAYDNNTDEVVSRLHFENEKLKWKIYRQIPTMADVMRHFDDAKKALHGLEKAARTSKRARAELNKAYKKLDDLEGRIT